MKYILLVCLVTLGLYAQAQTDRMQRISQLLDSLSQTIPGLNEQTTIALRDVPIHEYVRAIGVEHSVNVYIADRKGQVMTSNLINEPVKSVFLFVCQTFDYEIKPVGTILRFVPYVEQPEAPLKPTRKPLSLAYENDSLSLDLQNDSLFRVIRAISGLTNLRIITKPGADQLISVFVPPSPPALALRLLAEANDFRLRQNRKGYYILEPLEDQPADRNAPKTGNMDFVVEAFTDADNPFVTIEADNADLAELLKDIFSQTGLDYYIYGEVTGSVTVNIESGELEAVLSHLLQGTEYTYRKDGPLFLVGSNELNGLQTMEIVKLKYRPTYQALELIPGGQAGFQNNNGFNRQRSNRQNQGRNRNQNQAGGINQQGGFQNGQQNFGIQGNDNVGTNYFGDAQSVRMNIDGLEIVEYPELNRVILKGPKDRVQEMVYFLKEIDRPIPMVKVEMIVVEVNKSALVSTGIRAGIGSPPDSGRKEVLPGIDYTLTGGGINDIFQSSNIPFLQNIGTLNSNLYVQLKAEESRGNVSIRFTPILSMLNGRTGSLTIGQTQYFLLETTTQATGAVNNFQQFTQQFTEIEANITLSMRPFISEDNMVTLDVAPDFSNPVGSFSSDVPPTIATRRFESSIRVRNGETFILGGLTREEKSRNSRGTPFLSRIPILRWFFGNNTRRTEDSSLLIYITPTIYYN